MGTRPVDPKVRLVRERARQQRLSTKYKIDREQANKQSNLALRQQQYQSRLEVRQEKDRQQRAEIQQERSAQAEAKQQTAFRQGIADSGINAASSPFSGGGFGSTSTGQAVSSGGSTIAGSIFRILLVVIGLSILYLIVSNGGQGGTTLTNGLSSILSWFTSPTNMFTSTGVSSGAGPSGIQATNNGQPTPPNTLVPAGSFQSQPSGLGAAGLNGINPGTLNQVGPNLGSAANTPIPVGIGINFTNTFGNVAGGTSGFVANVLNALFPPGSGPPVFSSNPFTPAQAGNDVQITDPNTGITFFGISQNGSYFSASGNVAVPTSKGWLEGYFPSLQGFLLKGINLNAPQGKQGLNFSGLNETLANSLPGTAPGSGSRPTIPS